MLRQIHLIPRRIVSSGLDETPVTGALVTFDGFAPGEWHIELWDTREDRVTNSRNHAVEGDGRIESALPSIARDIAYRMHRVPWRCGRAARRVTHSPFIALFSS